MSAKTHTFIIISLLTAIIISCQSNATFPQINPTNTTSAKPPIQTTSAPLSPTETVVETIESSENRTQTITPDTPTPAVATPTFYPFIAYLQAQSPVYLINFLYPELGCQWAGIAGQIFDMAGIPVNGLIIEVSGTLGGEEYLGLGLTGLARAIGPGGFEIKLADHPFNSDHALRIQVYDQNGTQLSESFPLTTYNDCQKNLILINYILLDQSLKEKIFLPVIGR